MALVPAVDDVAAPRSYLSSSSPCCWFYRRLENGNEKPVKFKIFMRSIKLRLFGFNEVDWQVYDLDRVLHKKSLKGTGDIFSLTFIG